MVKGSALDNVMWAKSDFSHYNEVMILLVELY